MSYCAATGVKPDRPSTSSLPSGLTATDSAASSAAGLTSVMTLPSPTNDSPVACSVGASFVPAIKDFARLDKQFRLPDGVWEKLPQYKDFGFAVFKLKKPEKGTQQVHPMAFEFPREDKKVLFFPTVHIHDGTVPAKAKFDHSLFCQAGDVPPIEWEESPGHANSFVKVKETQGIVEPNAHVYRKLMKGNFDNKDVGVMA